MTALRWQRFLEELGYSVGVTESWSGGDAGLLIALHAYRSHQSIVEFKKKYPNRHIVLILTGTDLYRDMENHSEVIQSMEMADQLITLQSSALDSIPASLRYKAQVIYQSVEIDINNSLTKEDFLVSNIFMKTSRDEPIFLTKVNRIYLKS